MDIERIVAYLRQEMDRIGRAIAALEGSSGAATKRGAMAPRPSIQKRKRRGRLTPEGRKRLSDAMKKRWAERRRKG